MAASVAWLIRDGESGGLFTTGDDAEALLVRSKDVYDGATPSANSVAAVALLRLGALTGSERFTRAGIEILELMAPLLARQPMAFTNFLAAVDLVTSGVTEVVVSGDRPDLVAAVHARYLPNAVVAWGEPYSSPLWEGRTDGPADGKAFVCRDYACRAPVSDTDSLMQQLAG